VFHSLPLTLSLVKQKGREGKRKERREGRGEGRERISFFPFPYLICKGKMRGNTPY